MVKNYIFLRIYARISKIIRKLFQVCSDCCIHNIDEFGEGRSEGVRILRKLRNGAESSSLRAAVSYNADQSDVTKYVSPK